jgi:hypothetical protein
LTDRALTRATRVPAVLADPARLRGLALAALVIGAAAFDLSLARNHLFGVSGDDAYYLSLAQALATGHGFVDLNLPWGPPETSVPPGFPLLLAPLVALTSAHSHVLQAVPLVFAVLAVPLTFAYLRSLRLGFPLALGGAALVAFNPSLGLYSTIVMPETMFVCAVLALLLLARRWARAPAASGWGAGAVAAALVLFELKVAALLLLVPLAAALFATGRRAHALVLAIAVSAAGLPLLVVRLAGGVSPAGSTYDADFGTAYGGLHGGELLRSVAATVGRNLAALVYPTLAGTPTGLQPAWPAHGVAALAGALARDGLVALLTAAMLAGAWLLWRRTRDAGALAVPGYLLLVTAFPIMNTRRTVLVLPVLVAWLLLGLGEAHGRLAARLPPGVPAGWWRPALAAALAAAVAVPAAGVNLHDWRNYRSDWSVTLLPDRPWLRYLDREAGPGDLVEVLYPRQVYLATGVHADSSLWLGCAAAGREGSRRPFDDVLSRLRPRFVVATGTPGDCVPDMIRGDPDYRLVLQDGPDRVLIWERTG